MCVYICMYTLRSISIWKQDTYCIKMKRKHQHNSSHFPTEKCQMLHVVKLWATHWVEHCLSPREQCFLLEPGPSAPLAPALCSRTVGRVLVRSLTRPQQILVGWSRAGLNFNHQNAFTVLPWKIMYHCRAGKGCFRLYLVLIPPSLLLISSNTTLLHCGSASRWDTCSSSSFPAAGRTALESITSGSENRTSI